MTFVKSQSFCGGQNGLTILAKIIFNSLENIFDHLVRPFWPIFFWESFEFFMATTFNGSQVMCITFTDIGLIHSSKLQTSDLLYIYVDSIYIVGLLNQTPGDHENLL